MTNTTVAQFLAAAAEYFDLIDAASASARRPFVERAQRVVANLFRLAYSLPQVSPETSEEPPDEISDEQWWLIYKRVSETLGEADVYWLVFDPTDADEHEAIASTISDDLASIYRDLKDALACGTTEALTRDGLWTLRNSFETHWGQHAVSALAAMHALLYGPNPLID